MGHPFRTTSERTEREKDVERLGFWTNFEEGHGYSERTRTPPEAPVEDGLYRFK